MRSTKLMKMGYFDPKAEVRLEIYSDTIVIEKEGSISYIAAVRFGGYPETVRGMSDAIFGGGSVSIDINGEYLTVHSRTKQYRKEFSHDGIYAEATLMIQDEEQSIGQEGSSNQDGNGNNQDGNASKLEGNAIKHGGNNGNSGKTTYSSPRKCYLFCVEGDNERLFEELDKKTAVPLISDFKEYVLSELQSRDILRKLQVISCADKFDVWLLTLSEDEKNIVSVVNDGIKSGAISIPGSADNNFPAVNSVTGYLNTFGVMIAERIKNQFQPLFDPASESLSKEILAINSHIKGNTGYSLFDAQLAIAEAHKRCLERNKVTLCISECGSGKTKIGITALHAYQQRRNPGDSVKHFNIVLCPSHMTKKWVREIEESLPNTFVAVASNITDFDKVYAAFERDNKTCYVIMSKEKARDGYMKRPSAMWNQRQKSFICPNCHNPVMMELTEGGSKYRVRADQFFFKRENRQNHKCDNCKALLWTVLVPEKQSEWVEVSDCR